MMLSPDLIEVGALLLGALAVGGVAYALFYPYLSGEKQTGKRMASVTESKSSRVARNAQADVTANRRKAVADTLKDIEQRQKTKEKITLRLRMQRAGLDPEPRNYWIASGIAGAVLAALVFVVVTPPPPLAVGIAGFVGAFGLPRWVLARMTKRRQKKFTEEFANAIDVIVRGVKSGLPLNECLAIISRESPSPIREEFTELVDQQRVGVPLSECFERMIERIPLAEVKFFGIVIAIQQQAGGNLSEALGNLSGVLRDRKRLQAKVSALSAEAKASAMVLGCLPIVVMTMVYVTTPAYIAILWTTKTGQFLLILAGIWMTCGILVMRKMINFKY
jgi:tight adherence protein B